MKRIAILFLALLALTANAFGTTVTLSASQLTTLPFNPTNIGTTRTFTVSVTNGSATVTSAALFPSNIVGIGGFQILIGSTQYVVSGVASTSSLTLTTNYSGSTGSATLTLYPYVLLKAYATAGFQDNVTGQNIQPGTPGSGNFYKQIAVSIINSGSGNVAYLPEFTLPSTTDALINNQARYVFGFYRTDGSLLSYYVCGSVQQLAVPPSTPTTWTALCNYNSPGGVVPPNNEVYTKGQIDQRFPNCSQGQSYYFAANGNIVSCLNFGSGLTLAGNTLTASGGGGGTTTVVQAYNVKLDGSCVGNGVTNDTSCVSAAYTAAIAANRPLYFPAGTYLVDGNTLTVATNSITIFGDGPGRSTIQNRTAGAAITLNNNAALTHSVAIRDLSLVGFGSGSSDVGLLVSGTGNEPYGLNVERVTIGNMAGRGIYVTSNLFTSRFVDIDVSVLAAGSNGIDIGGGADITLENCYVHSVGTNGAAYRLHAGVTTLIACNGIDSGTNADWIVLGDSTGTGDPSDRFARVNLINCNVEAFTNRGVYAKSGSYVNKYEGVTFLAPASGTVTPIKYDFVDTGQRGTMDAATSFTTQGASYTNSSAVNSNGAPFIQIGGTEFATYYDTNVGSAVTLPYMTASLIPGSTNIALDISRGRIQALESSTLVGDLTGSNSFTGNPSRLVLQNGTDVRPTIAQSTSLATGIFFAATDQIGFTSNGSQKFLLTTTSHTLTGNLGINTSGSGSYALDVASGSVRVTNSSGSSTAVVEGKGNNNPYFLLTDTSASAIVGRFQTLSGAPDRLTIGSFSNHPFGLYTNSTERWTVGTAGHLTPGTDDSYDIGSASLRIRTGYFGTSLELGRSSVETGTLTFQNSTNSNTLTLQAGATGSNLTFTLPTTDSTGTQCLSSNGSGVLGWSACSAGSGSPGGSNTQVQYNAAGSFGGISGFTSDGTNVTAGSANLRATRPRITTSLDDSSGNELFVLTATASAVNEITVANAATGNNPTLTASGGDTNVGINFVPKGSGTIQVSGVPIVTTTATQTLTNKTLTASSNVLGGVTMTLGSDATGDVYYRNSGGVLTRLAIGSSGNCLTVAAGLPSWSSCGTGTITGSGTTGTIAKFTGSSAVGDSILTESSTTLTTAGRQTINGLTISTDANNTVASLTANSTFTKNNTNSRTFYGVLVKPTFNFGGSNANTEVNLLQVDSTNTATTGTIFNLLHLKFGGSTVFNVDSAGAITFANGVRQAFVPDTVNASLNVGQVGSDPSSGVNGDIVYHTGTNKFRCYENTTWVDCIGSGSGSGTVTSVAQSFTGGLISVSGSPVTTSGTLALTVAGTSGGIPYFSSASTWASSGALTANMPVIGGGAGVAPTVGTVSGNTTKFVTTTGTLTSGRCAEWDGSGNLIQSSGACSGGSGSPGGSNTQVQYNAAGSFGGISGFTSDGTNITAGSGNLLATRPRITTSLDDSSGNELLVLTATASAVNEITLANAATGNNPTFTASGGDTNVGINFAPKGSGTIQVSGVPIVTTTATQTLTNKTLTAPVIATISNTGTLTLPTSTDTLVGKATTDTFTNKTYDTSATGNVFSMPVNTIFLAAGCNNTTAGTAFDIPTSGGATSACLGTTTTQGVLEFADGSTTAATNHMVLPTDFTTTGGVDVRLIYTGSTNSTNNIRFQVSCGCIADNEDAIGVAYNTGSASNTAGPATAGLRKSVTFTNVAITGCAAGETMYIKVERIGADGGDTYTGIARLMEMEVVYRRSM